MIVVDNGSSDGTAQVARRHADDDPRVSCIVESRRGAPCARNSGVAAARAPILAFIDDDVRPRADWIASIVAAFAQHPEVDCIGGRVEPRWPCPPPPWLTRAHWPPLALQVDCARSRYIDRGHTSACLITANFACRAEVFREVGGFAPEFLRDEDREFNLRLWRAGKRGLYVDSVVAFAEVQPERLEKRYHRQWYRVTGSSHARLWYPDVIDRAGRLDDAAAARGRRWLGVPCFLYREFLQPPAPDRASCRRRVERGVARRVPSALPDQLFRDALAAAARGRCRLRRAGHRIPIALNFATRRSPIAPHKHRLCRRDYVF